MSVLNRKLVKIKVTKEDIKKGKANNGTRCPIAIASKRLLKKVNFVCASGIYFKGGWFGQDSSFFMTDVPKNFVREFDRENKVKPFTFSIMVPTEYIK